MADEYQEKMMVASGVPYDPEDPQPPETEVEMETIKAQPGGGTDLDSLDSSTNESSDDDLFVTKEDGGTAWVKKSFLKIWNYISSKLGIFIGTSATWEAKTTAEKDTYNLIFITDDNINSQTAYDIPHGSSNVGDDLDGIRSDFDTQIGAHTVAKNVPSDAQFTDTTYTGATLKTSVAKTGSGTTVTNSIASNTSMDNAIGTLLNNDVALKSALITHQAVIFNNLIGFAERNKAVHVFANLTSLDSTKTVIEVQASAPYLPVLSYAILPLYSTTAPYTQIGTIWIYNNGTVKMYKPANVTTGYVSGCYVCQ